MSKIFLSFALAKANLGSLDEWLSQRSAKPCTAVRIRQVPPLLNPWNMNIQGFFIFHYSAKKLHKYPKESKQLLILKIYISPFLTIFITSKKRRIIFYLITASGLMSGLIPHRLRYCGLPNNSISDRLKGMSTLFSRKTP